MNKHIEIANDLLKIAKMLLSTGIQLPPKGDYHNNPTDIDAHIGCKEQKKINYSCRKKANRDGVSNYIFDEVLRNIKELFLNAQPEGNLLNGTKNQDAYDKRYYYTSYMIKNHSYSIRFMVKFPTKDEVRKKENAQKNKLYSVEVHK